MIFMNHKLNLITLATLIVVFALEVSVQGQSSSLFHQENVPQVTTPAALPRDVGGRVSQLNPEIAAYSFTAIALPEPRRYAVNDLITIIIQESIRNSSDSSLETEKEVEIQGEVVEFPNLNLSDLLNLRVGEGDVLNNPRLDIDLNTEFEGEGSHSRSDTYSGRIQARIVEIKPNGTLVLEARKFLKSDKESLELILMGVCRPDDITVSNTVLSSELYDLRLIKNHEGELKKSSKKGVLTRALEFLFNF